jgi:hypothetical protein
LWQVQTSGIEFFPQKMQLSIVARPYFTNWTFPPKKCNCGKSGLQELNFSPKNAIVASLGLTILEKLTFPPKKCKCPDFRNWTCPPQKWKTISCGTSRLQNLNFPQKKLKVWLWGIELLRPQSVAKNKNMLGKVQISNIEAFPPNNPSDGKVQFQVHENPGWIQIIDIYIDGTFTPSSSRLKSWNTGLRNGIFTKQSSLVLWETQE